MEKYEKVGRYELSQNGKSLKFQGNDGSIDFSKIFSSDSYTKGGLMCKLLYPADIVGSNDVIPVMKSSSIMLNSKEHKSIVLIRKEKTNE